MYRITGCQQEVSKAAVGLPPRAHSAMVQMKLSADWNQPRQSPAERERVHLLQGRQLDMAQNSDVQGEQ
jgi:hypothetical protein